MVEYRITKFDPALRELDGRYLDDDWTSISDVGKQFKGKTLTLTEYRSVEDAYVETVRRLLHAANVFTLRVRSPEDKSPRAEPGFEIEGNACFLPEGKELSGSDIDWVVRLNLRELFWCRLEGTKQTFVHFGYDYYMYFGTNADAFVLPSLPKKIYPEICESPHEPEDG